MAQEWLVMTPLEAHKRRQCSCRARAVEMLLHLHFKSCPPRALKPNAESFYMGKEGTWLSREARATTDRLHGTVPREVIEAGRDSRAQFQA